MHLENGKEQETSFLMRMEVSFPFSKRAFEPKPGSLVGSFFAKGC